MRARPVGRGRVGIEDVVLPAQVADVLHRRHALVGCEVAHPAAVFILIFQRVFTHAAEIPRDIGEQPAAIRLARREYQPRLARLFADNLTVFRHFLQGLGVNRQTFLVHQPRLAEQGDIDVHTQHIAVARQTVDAAVLVRQPFEVRRAELIQHARALQRIGHVADQMLADQQLRVGKRRLEDARRRAALRHRNVAAQGVGVVIRHQRHVRVLLLHRFAVALKERLFRLRRRIRGPVAQRNRAGQVRINDLFRHRQRQRAQHQAQHQQHGNQFLRPSHGKTSFTSSWRIFVRFNAQPCLYYSVSSPFCQSCFEIFLKRKGAASEKLCPRSSQRNVLFAFLENDHQSLCICPVNHLLIFRVAENHRMAAAEGIIRQRLHTVRDNDQPQ